MGHELAYGIRIGAKDETAPGLKSALNRFSQFGHSAARAIEAPFKLVHRAIEGLGKIGLAGLGLEGIKRLGEQLDGFIERGARLEVVRKSFESLSGRVGEQADRLAEKLAGAAHGMLRISDAMEVANVGLAAGLNTSQMTTMLDFVSRKAVTTGQDVAETLRVIMHGLATGQPRGIQELGLLNERGLLGVTDAFDARAGKGAFEALPAAAQKAEIIRAVLADMNRQMGKIGVTGRELVFTWQAMKNHFTEWVEKLALAVAKSETLKDAVRGINTFAAGLEEHFKTGGTFGELFFGKTRTDKAGHKTETPGLFDIAGAAIRDAVSQIGSFVVEWGTKFGAAVWRAIQPNLPSFLGGGGGLLGRGPLNWDNSGMPGGGVGAGFGFGRGGADVPMGVVLPGGIRLRPDEDAKERKPGELPGGEYTPLDDDTIKRLAGLHSQRKPRRDWRADLERAGNLLQAGAEGLNKFHPIAWLLDGISGAWGAASSIPRHPVVNEPSGHPMPPSVAKRIRYQPSNYANSRPQFVTDFEKKQFPGLEELRASNFHPASSQPTSSMWRSLGDWGKRVGLAGWGLAKKGAEAWWTGSHAQAAQNAPKVGWWRTREAAQGFWGGYTGKGTEVSKKSNEEIDAQLRQLGIVPGLSDSEVHKLKMRQARDRYQLDRVRLGRGGADQAADAITREELLNLHKRGIHDQRLDDEIRRKNRQRMRGEAGEQLTDEIEQLGQAIGGNKGIQKRRHELLRDAAKAERSGDSGDQNAVTERLDKLIESNNRSAALLGKIADDAGGAAPRIGNARG